MARWLMNTNKMTQEQISALADGELDAGHVDVTLAALCQSRGREAWDVYHQIGHVLRSDCMAVSLSAGFEARMAARLAGEPVIRAPVSAHSRTHFSQENNQEQAAAKAAPVGRNVTRWALAALSGTAAVAAATVAFLTAPLMVATMEKSPAAPGFSMMASAPNAGSTSMRLAAPAGSIVSPEAEQVVLRDPRIDEYLAAHQRFSPSPYHTAHYARSATFAANSNK